MLSRFLLLQAGLLSLGLAGSGHAIAGESAASALKDLNMCVWDATSNADRTALMVDPTVLPSTSYDQIIHNNPSASAAFDRCRNDETTPVPWKGIFLLALGSEHWATAGLKAQGIDENQLGHAWRVIPMDQQICFGVLVTYALGAADPEVNEDYGLLMQSNCGEGTPPLKIQAYMDDLHIAKGSKAANYAVTYAQMKGWESAAIHLLAFREAHRSSITTSK